MQSKSTRAFRTISEAGEELGLQPHVLRFWESKFSQIQPMKRSGGRRFYRPEDIELLRGIKILLHREKHPIKDVQKLIRIRGPQSVVDLGRSVQKASKPKDIKETNLVPKRIKPVVHTSSKDVAETKPQKTGLENAPVPEPEHSSVVPFLRASASPPEIDTIANEADEHLHNKSKIDRDELELALSRLKALRLRWKDFE